MLECWNIGRMGFGIRLGKDNSQSGKCFTKGCCDRIKMDNIPLSTTIPFFHYSIIPWLK
jgi:hypothetical protein